MILVVACVLSVLVSAAVFVLARRQAQAQRLPVEASHRARVLGLPVPGRLLYLGAVVLVAAATGLLAWTVNGGESRPPALPGETVVILDLSGSITSQGDRMISRSLEGFRNYPPDRRAAIVYFSSTAHLGSPPSSPASALAGLDRFFAQTRSRERGPWAASLDGGTIISKALALAGHVLKLAGARHGRVALLSDLQDNPKDTRKLHEQLVKLAADHVEFELLPLPPTRNTPSSLELLSEPYRAVFGDHIILSRPVLVAGTDGRPAPEPAIIRARHPSLAFLLALVVAASALAVSLFPRLAWRLG